MRRSAFEDFDYRNQVIEINGVKMTMAQYNAKKAAATRAKNAKEVENSIIPYIPTIIKDVTKGLKMSKNLAAYQANGYRQWGTIIQTVESYIGHELTLFNAKYREVLAQIKKINTSAKRKSKAIYDEVEKLFYMTDDLSILLKNLSDKAVSSELLNDPMLFGKECLKGSKDGRRLGIQQLITRTTKELASLSTIKEQLNAIIIEN